ncbi:hypothetical protein ARUL111621_08955 [Arthrobacter ulcerisalmonis]
MALRCGVRDGVRGSSSDGNGLRERDFLPAGRRLRGVGSGGEALACGIPQRRDVRAGVGCRLVEAGAGDETVHAGSDAHPQFVGAAVVRVHRLGDLLAKHRVGARELEVTGGGGADVGAVIHGADLQRGGGEALLDVRVGPVLLALRWVPRRAAVGGNLDAGHYSAHVGGGTGGGDTDAVRQGRVLRRGRDGGSGPGGIRACRCCRKCGVAGTRLGAHVGKEVDLGLLHPRISCCTLAVVVLVQAPRPLDGSGAKDQGSTGRTVQREVVGGGARGDHVAEVAQVLAGGTCGGGQLDQASGPEAIIQVFVRLVTNGVRRQGSGGVGGQ